jgi:hypothetical protein
MKSIIDEKGTLKAIEQDQYENIAGSVWLSLIRCISGIATPNPVLGAPTLHLALAPTGSHMNKQVQVDLMS